MIVALPGLFSYVFYIEIGPVVSDKKIFKVFYIALQGK